MAKLQINNNDDVVTYTPNVLNSPSPVWTIRVPEKIVYTIMDKALLVLKLRDLNGDEIQADTDIIFSGIRPGKRLPTEIDSKDYRPYSALNVNEQYDSNKNGMLRLHIEKGRLDLLETHRFIIMANSGTLIDPDESFFEIEIDESPYRDR